MLIRFLRRNKEYRRNKFTTLLSVVNMSAEYENAFSERVRAHFTDRGVRSLSQYRIDNKS